MDALIASYGDTSSDSDSDSGPTHIPEPTQTPPPLTLPPPPLSLLQPQHFAGNLRFPHKSQTNLRSFANKSPNKSTFFLTLTPNKSPNKSCSKQISQTNRLRSFPHIEGSYALHVYIPVTIPISPRKELALFLKRVASIMNELHVVDIDIPLNSLIKDEQKFEQIVLGREFHVSLGRTVPIRVHQRDSMVAMLRQKLQSHRRYWIDFNKWEVFVNDDCTRTFLSVEVTTAGLNEIKKQIEAVNGVYKLHNLPEFYQNPRPHISIAWAVGDISNRLKSVIGDEMKGRTAIGGLSNMRIFNCRFDGVSCKIGNRTYEICKVKEE